MILGADGEESKELTDYGEKVLREEQPLRFLGPVENLQIPSRFSGETMIRERIHLLVIWGKHMKSSWKKDRRDGRHSVWIICLGRSVKPNSRNTENSEPWYWFVSSGKYLLLAHEYLLRLKVHQSPYSFFHASHVNHIITLILVLVQFSALFSVCPVLLQPVW